MISELMNSPKVIQLNCKYWLHRVSHEWDVSYKLLAGGYLSIGWGALAGSGIEKIAVDGDIKQFETTMIEWGYQLTRSRWSLWNFFRLSPNDFVVVPLFNGKFSIYKVKGIPIPITELVGFADFISEDGSRILRDKEVLFRRYENNEIVDIGFVVKVEVVKENLSRYEYADSRLTARMKIRQTNADISDLAENVQHVISAESPINLYATVIEELAGRLLNAIKVQLTPDKFELLIKWYFERMGASRTLRPGKNSSDKWDGADIDIVAEFDALKVVFYIQAKLHDNVTSQWAVEQISKYKDQHEISFGEYTAIPWVISTADVFSVDAITMAQENNVRLVTGGDFARMLIDAGITDINRAFDSV